MRAPDGRGTCFVTSVEPSGAVGASPELRARISDEMKESSTFVQGMDLTRLTVVAGLRRVKQTRPKR